MQQLLISIIVPVYNERKYLEKCVCSIMEQTYQNLEIILVDDGSTDGTEHICDALADTDKRIKVIHKTNGGLSSSRYTGLQNATGEWLMFVDDDDVISPFMIETFLENIDDSVDIVSGQRVDLIDDNYRWEKPIDYNYVVMTGTNAVETIPRDGQKTIITPLWGKIYRTSFIKKLDLAKYQDICPTIYFEDVLMTPIILSKANRIGFVHEVFYLHREVSTSISRSGKLGSFYFEQIESGRILLEYSASNNLPNYYAYQVGIYLNSILRIWALMDKKQL